MNHRSLLGTVTIAAATLVTGAAAPKPQPRIVSVEARLFRSDIGEFSKNILHDGYFGGWNTIIGAGDVAGPAEDILILVRVGTIPAADGEVVIDVPLVVTARTARKQLAQRRFNAMLVPYRGTAAHGLYLPHATCAGRIDVTATLGKQTRRAKLDMMCGE
jgi:hypothetical protein